MYPSPPKNIQNFDQPLREECASMPVGNAIWKTAIVLHFFCLMRIRPLHFLNRLLQFNFLFFFFSFAHWPVRSQFSEAIGLAEQGVAANVDLLVSDIYGGDYTEWVTCCLLERRRNNEESAMQYDGSLLRLLGRQMG